MKLLRETTRRLSSVYSEGEASALARWVMEDGFGLSLTDLMLDKDSELSSLQLQELENITERLLQKEPIQYILGQTTFCGLSVGVGPDVLIPRPETQELVEWICQDHHYGTTRPEDCKTGRLCTQTKHVLDIGTGSGCIALALAHHGFKVEAWDISDGALETARRNAERLQLNVEFKKEDILQNSLSQSREKVFDIIVSNPPYICLHEMADMDANVLDYEPHLALFVPDDDPLLFYRHIGLYAIHHLHPGGNLYLEINRAYAEDTKLMLSELGFKDIQVRIDQYDNPRMARATLPNP